MREITPHCRRRLPAGTATQLRRAARKVAGSVALAACLLATTAAVPAAVPSVSHGNLASPGRSARRTSHDAVTATAVSQWIHIATGGYHTCGIREGNTLWCWGNAAYGELGAGGAADQEQPQQVSKPTAGWTSVATGYYHSCATRNDGSLWCWGYNHDGELGIGTTTNVTRPHQVTTPAATAWASVTAGLLHTCAIGSGTTLWCWGYNDDGELGIGNTTSQDLPQQVTTPAAAGWTHVADGNWHTCAIRDDGSLWCWGDNDDGQLGIGATSSQDLPRQVTTPAAAGWAMVAGGGGHTCAVRTDGTLWCWGFNSAGELGTGNTTNQDLPQQVTIPAATGWTSVAAGGGATCALRTHALRCWGFNAEGQLGIGSTTSQDLPRQVTVPATTGWSRLALGISHTCATHTGHTLWCWGDNQDGDLGIGNTTQQNLPQQVTS
jgi:alpha-tubulin suppressor-like RCC1 family protein